jgi:phage terminase large subunit-like protein
MLTWEIPTFTPSCKKVKKWWHSKAKIKLLVGANMSGKTETAAAYVADYTRNHSDKLIWCIAPDFDMSRICYQKLRKYFGGKNLDGEIIKKSWRARNKELPYSISHKNRTTIMFKSCETGFLKFEGAEVDLIWADEEIAEKKIYTSCVARTTMTNGQILLSFTPLHGKTWCYHDLFMSKNPDIYATTISLYDNIFLDPIRRDNVIRLYSSEEQEYRIYGRWGVLEGRIFKTFSESNHVIAYNQDIINHLRVIIRGIDFGRTLACTWIGLDNNEIAYVIAELKVTETTLEDFAHQIFTIEDSLNIRHRIDTTITDHAFQERLELQKYDIFCSLATKHVNNNIDIVRRRLKIQDDGSTNLMIFDHCKKLIEEILEYQYKNVRGKGKELSGEPRKVNDHLVDTMLYNVAELEKYCTYAYTDMNQFISVAQSEI